MVGTTNKSSVRTSNQRGNTSRNVVTVHAAMAYLTLDLSLIRRITYRGRETLGSTLRSQVILGVFRGMRDVLGITTAQLAQTQHWTLSGINNTTTRVSGKRVLTIMSRR